MADVDQRVFNSSEGVQEKFPDGRIKIGEEL